MEDQFKVIKTEEELKIFSDPYRMKIINVFNSSSEPLTVKGVADILGEVPAKVHYHVKKLISINILELDHVEIINGINAKYYRMPIKRFRVDLMTDEENAEDRIKHVDHVTRFMIQMIDSFKEDVVKRSENLKEKQLDKERVGLITKKDIYLTEEEYKEAVEFIIDLTSKIERSPEKTKFSFLGGITKKEE